MTLTFASHSPGVIDAIAVRNVAAFINFSCDPNLELRKVEGAHGNRKSPRAAFFAKEDIQTGQELGYRRDPSATSKRMFDRDRPCYCGKRNCRGFI